MDEVFIVIIFHRIPVYHPASMLSVFTHRDNNNLLPGQGIPTVWQTTWPGMPAVPVTET